MKNNQEQGRSRIVGDQRWAAYVAAGTAALTAGTETAEADITHIVVNGGAGQRVEVGGSYYFSLVGNAAVHLFNYSASQKNGQTYAGAFAGVFNNSNFYGAVVGFFSNDWPYVSNLALGLDVSAGPFLTKSHFGTLAYGGADSYTNAQFKDPGDGFLGFNFTVGIGAPIQYGWMRVTMDGGPSNTFTVQEYAFADAGESIQVGQIDAIPEPSSLGALALGAVGLAALRRRRSPLR